MNAQHMITNAGPINTSNGGGAGERMSEGTDDMLGTGLALLSGEEKKISGLHRDSYMANCQWPS